MAKYNVLFSGAANTDLRAVYRRIAYGRSEPITATNVIADIKRAAYSLDNMPQRCAMVSDSRLALLGYHKLIVKNHIIFFVIDEKKQTVKVRRILYARRDWQNILS